VSFDGANYILYTASPTGDDPDVDTAHWDTFGSGSGVSPSRSIATTSPLAGGGDLSADRTLTLNIGTGLTTSGGNLVPDFGSGSGKVTQGNDSRLSDARTPTAHASSHTDGGSDEIAVALAQLTQSGATTGQVPKWNGSAWAPASESGGGSLPSQTGHAGEALATDGSSAGWQDNVEKTASGTTAGVSWGSGAAALTAVNGSDEASAQVTPAGTEMYSTDGTDEKYARLQSDGFHVVGDVGETVLSGDDYRMETASDTDVQAPGATFARARGSMVSKSAVTNGDILAYPLYAQGHDGTSLVLAGQITAEVDGTVATGKVPTRIRIATADADGVLTDRMTIGADGTTDVLGDFTVNGSPVSGGGGGLVLIDSGTFSASSGVNVDSVFSGTYDDYLVLVHATASADAELKFRLRLSGTDATSAYTSVRAYAYGTTPGVQTDNAGTDEWQINNLGNTAVKGVTRLDLMSPAIAAATAAVGQSVGYFSSTSTIITTLGATHATATAYDGFSLIPSAGDITGRWAVYGYPK